MSKKMKMILIIIVIFLIIASFVVCLIENKNNEKTSFTIYNQINYKIKTKDNFFVFITNNYFLEENNFNKVLNYYKEVYDFDFIEFNINKSSKNDYDKLYKIVNAEEFSYPLPFLAYFEKGNIKMKANVVDEYTLKTFLLENNLIDKKYEDIDYLLDDSEFEKYINSDKEHILFYAFNDKDIYEYRKKMLKSGSEYWLMYQHRVRNIKSDEYMNKWFDLDKEGDYNLPMLIKFKDGKIIEYRDGLNLDNIVNEFEDLNK